MQQITTVSRMCCPKCCMDWWWIGVWGSLRQNDEKGNGQTRTSEIACLFLHSSKGLTLSLALQQYSPNVPRFSGSSPGFQIHQLGKPHATPQKSLAGSKQQQWHQASEQHSICGTLVRSGEPNKYQVQHNAIVWPRTQIARFPHPAITRHSYEL